MEGTVTISLSDYEKMKRREEKLIGLEWVLKNAFIDGKAVMTKELKKTIEEIYN